MTRLPTVIGVVAGAVVWTVVCLFALTRSSQHELAQWTSPDGEHHLIVFEGERDWRSFPLAVARHHYIYVGRAAQSSSYGHQVSWDPHAEMVDAFDADLVAYLNTSRVEWTDVGVSFQEPSGHRVFIPRRAYVGGR